MAKKQAVAQAPVEEKEQQSALAVQDGGQVSTGDEWNDYQGSRGTEDISSTDVNIPRLKMCQALTPEVKDGLAKSGDILHNITKQVYCPLGERIELIPVCFDKQYLLWRDRNYQGGGIMARGTKVILPDGSIRYQWAEADQYKEFDNVVGKVRVKWTTGRFVEDNALTEFGSSIPGQPDSGPAATLHYNYVFILPQFGHQMVAVSLARTAARKAKDLNAIVKMGAAPIWARRLEVTAIKEQKDANEWFNWFFQPAGLLKRDDPLVAQLEQLNAELRKKGINVDFSDNDDGSTDAAAPAQPGGKF
jgi:hypothetical protein